MLRGCIDVYIFGIPKTASRGPVVPKGALLMVDFLDGCMTCAIPPRR